MLIWAPFLVLELLASAEGPKPNQVLAHDVTSGTVSAPTDQELQAINKARQKRLNAAHKSFLGYSDDPTHQNERALQVAAHINELSATIEGLEHAKTRAAQLEGVIADMDRDQEAHEEAQKELDEMEVALSELELERKQDAAEEAAVVPVAIPHENLKIEEDAGAFLEHLGEKEAQALEAEKHLEAVEKEVPVSDFVWDENASEGTNAVREKIHRIKESATDAGSAQVELVSLSETAGSELTSVALSVETKKNDLEVLLSELNDRGKRAVEMVKEAEVAGDKANELNAEIGVKLEGIEDATNAGVDPHQLVGNEKVEDTHSEMGEAQTLTMEAKKSSKLAAEDANHAEELVDKIVGLQTELEGEISHGLELYGSIMSYSSAAENLQDQEKEIHQPEIYARLRQVNQQAENDHQKLLGMKMELSEISELLSAVELEMESILEVAKSTRQEAGCETVHAQTYQKEYAAATGTALKPVPIDCEDLAGCDDTDPCEPNCAAAATDHTHHTSTACDQIIQKHLPT